MSNTVISTPSTSQVTSTMKCIEHPVGHRCGDSFLITQFITICVSFGVALLVQRFNSRNLRRQLSAEENKTFKQKSLERGEILIGLIIYMEHIIIDLSNYKKNGKVLKEVMNEIMPKISQNHQQIFAILEIYFPSLSDEYSTLYNKRTDEVFKADKDKVNTWKILASDLIEKIGKTCK